MQNPIKLAAGWVASAIVDKLKEPMETVNRRLERLEELHRQDAAALECDLSIMDDRICYLIGVARKRGYTTADERRRITRMHDAYRARGGNHGEELEFTSFLALPTEEEYMRDKEDEKND